MRAIIALFSGLVGLACLSAPVVAQEALGKKSRAAVHQFAANNSLFVLYHEVGHLLIDQLQLPVLGREEDAADNIATWILLNKGTQEATDALADAAYGWLLTGLAYDESLDDSDFQGEHSLNKQRAFQIVCHMVGSDDTGYRAIANSYAMNQWRQESCYWDHDLMDRTMQALLRSHVNLKTRSGGITVTYHDVSGRLKPAADAFRQSGVFDAVADELESRFPIREPIAFNARRCGEENAFYDPNTIEVIFCYELMAEFMEFAQKDIQAKGNIQLGPGGTTRIDQWGPDR
jgi:hypothetical protein